MGSRVLDLKRDVLQRDQEIQLLKEELGVGSPELLRSPLRGTHDVLNTAVRRSVQQAAAAEGRLHEDRILQITDDSLAASLRQSTIRCFHNYPLSNTALGLAASSALKTNTSSMLRLAEDDCNSYARKAESDAMCYGIMRKFLVPPPPPADCTSWQSSRGTRAREVAEALSRSSQRMARLGPQAAQQPRSPSVHSASLSPPRPSRVRMQRGMQVQALRNGTEWEAGMICYVAPDGLTAAVEWYDGVVDEGVPVGHVRVLTLEEQQQQHLQTAAGYISPSPPASPQKPSPVLSQQQHYRRAAPTRSTPTRSRRQTPSRRRDHSSHRHQQEEGLASVAAGWNASLRSPTHPSRRSPGAVRQRAPLPSPPPSTRRSPGSTRPSSLHLSKAARQDEYRHLFEPLKQYSTIDTPEVSLAPKLPQERRFTTPRGWACNTYHLETKVK